MTKRVSEPWVESAILVTDGRTRCAPCITIASLATGVDSERYDGRGRHRWGRVRKGLKEEHINLVMSARAAAGTRALQKCFETTRTKPET